MSKQNVELEVGVGILIETLKEDSDYYYGWQSNIAMAFYDEVRRRDIKISHVELLDISNESAKNFLNRLISDGDSKEKGGE